RWTLGPAGPQTLRATLGNLQVTLRADAMAHGTRVLLTQVPGRILDATPGRVLWVDSAGVRAVRVRHLPAGTDETIATGLTAVPTLGHLYSAGALFAVPAGGPAGELFEWRNGTLASLGQVDLWAGVRLSGEWVAWGTAAGRYRRDLAAGATITLPGAGAVLAVGPNGDVIWNEDSGRRRMQRYRDGQVTSFAFSNMNEDVVTDGVHVAAAERIMGNEWFRLVSGDGGTATQELLSYNPWVGFARTYGRGYDVSGGWVAWASHRQNVSWSRQGTYYVYRRPEPLTGHRRGMVETLAPNGELMYRTPEGEAWDAPIVRFLDVPGGLVWDFGLVADGERVVWRDGAFLLITSDGTLYELHR
ncbi:MAG TPA: hypothetical protein VFJ82_23795, partial [Longimicrobium sp.]|nr:hypothetical protein [Longimicrobium sp.]